MLGFIYKNIIILNIHYFLGIIMIGIYFSGTGNSKYCLEYFLECYTDNYKIFSVEELNNNK